MGLPARGPLVGDVGAGEGRQRETRTGRNPESPALCRVSAPLPSPPLRGSHTQIKHARKFLPAEKKGLLSGEASHKAGEEKKRKSKSEKK